MASQKHVRWESVENMPTKRVFATPILVNNKLYVLGGCNIRGRPLDAFEMFDMDTGIWLELEKLPRQRAQPTVLALDTLIYCIGGVDINQNPMKHVDVYDTVNKEWRAVKSLPYELMGTAGVIRDNQIYIVGGMKLDKTSSSELLRYDPATDEWFTEDSMTTPRYASGAFNIRDRLYVIGGRDSTSPVTAFEVYDFETKRWRQLTDIHTGRVFPMYAITDTNIYSIGGLRPVTHDKKQQGAAFSDNCDIFNLDKEEWSKGEPMPTRRGDAAVGVLNQNQVVVVGGLNDSGVPLNNTEIYDEVSGTWREMKPIPSAHCSCTYLIHDQKLYVLGGLSRNGPSGNMEWMSLS